MAAVFSTCRELEALGHEAFDGWTLSLDGRPTLCQQLKREACKTCQQLKRETCETCQQLKRETCKRCQQLKQETCKTCQQLKRETCRTSDMNGRTALCQQLKRETSKTHGSLDSLSVQVSQESFPFRSTWLVSFFEARGPQLQLLKRDEKWQSESDFLKF